MFAEVKIRNSPIRSSKGRSLVETSIELPRDDRTIVCLQCMDVLARDRAFDMPNQGGNRDLGEPQIVRDAGEAVPQTVRGDVRDVSSKIFFQ